MGRSPSTFCCKSRSPATTRVRRLVQHLQRTYHVSARGHVGRLARYECCQQREHDNGATHHCSIKATKGQKQRRMTLARPTPNGIDKLLRPAKGPTLEHAITVQVVRIHPTRDCRGGRQGLREQSTRHPRAIISVCLLLLNNTRPRR
jgi:hypothetical protein